MTVQIFLKFPVVCLFFCQLSAVFRWGRNYCAGARGAGGMNESVRAPIGGMWILLIFGSGRMLQQAQSSYQYPDHLFERPNKTTNMKKPKIKKS